MITNFFYLSKLSVIKKDTKPVAGWIAVHYSVKKQSFCNYAQLSRLVKLCLGCGRMEKYLNFQWILELISLRETPWEP